MPSWFIGKIRYQQDNGELDKRGNPVPPKTINETYLLDAVSYSDAEARLYNVVADNTPDFQITTIRPMRLSDVFHIDGAGEKWYKCKVVYVTEDERSGKEKKIVNNMLVNAGSVKQAHERIEDSLKTMLVPFDITDINLTPILEVVPYEDDAQRSGLPATGLPANLRPLATGVPATE